MIDNEILRQIQLSGLSLLHKFDQVCSKYNVRYFAFAGTLLGAVRHHGYIPWDDDLDLGIFREDYKKLEAIPAEEWGDSVELISPSDPAIKHDKLFPRMYLKNSHIQSYNDVRDWIDPSTHKAWHTSLMIDLFVFDTIPDDDKKYLKIRKKVIRMKDHYKPMKLIANCKVRSPKRFAINFCKYLYGSVYRILWKDPWKRIYTKHLSIIDSEEAGSRTGCYYSSYAETNFPTEDIFPLQKMQFEDMEIPVPNNYKDFLEVAYGKTYMEYPPEKDRYHINFIYADLGNGQVFNIDPIPGSLGEQYAKEK